jgi:hypothetical protein
VATGLLLSVLLLVETVYTYRYVGRGLVREEAQRESDERVRSIVRAARLAKIEQSPELARLIREVGLENPGQTAWIRIIAMDGQIVAASDYADEGPRYSRDEMRTVAVQQRAREWKTAAGQVFLALSPILLRSTGDRPLYSSAGATPEPDFIEVATYLKGISVNFGPLRQDLVVGLSASFALFAAIIVIAVRFRDYLGAKQIEKELALARQVQLDLFPDEGSLITHIHFAARCLPALQVGGDLYDVFETDNGETAFVLGDVSGKGLSAALLMGLVQGAVRASCAGNAAMKCDSVAEQLNKLLSAKTARNRFVSLFWSAFNAHSSSLRYVNAGHCPALLIRGPAEILRLEAGGPVLGVLPGARYDYGSVTIRAGDLLVIFSDGIVEAADADEQEFGEERLISAIQRNWRKSPAEICEGILASVSAFIGRQAPQDDQTLVVARLEPRQMKRIASAKGEGIVAAEIVSA